AARSRGRGTGRGGGRPRVSRDLASTTTTPVSQGALRVRDSSANPAKPAKPRGGLFVYMPAPNPRNRGFRRRFGRIGGSLLEGVPAFFRGSARSLSGRSSTCRLALVRGPRKHSGAPPRVTTRLSLHGSATVGGRSRSPGKRKVRPPVHAYDSQTPNIEQERQHAARDAAARTPGAWSGSRLPNGRCAAVSPTTANRGAPRPAVSAPPAYPGVSQSFVRQPSDPSGSPHQPNQCPPVGAPPPRRT
ncbi:MAG: hypothetical protein JWM10_3137, partial [Myxococcaceae bacterium]|nr:hypothetical protein [Myxococcaceae bacterium]